MTAKNRSAKKPEVAESPVQDVFEGRHPAESEKEWAERTLEAFAGALAAFARR